MNSPKEERRYDNVRITNIVDGTKIEGHDAVETHIDREQEMLVEYGESIFFQVYRLNLKADTLKDLQGEKLAEFKVEGSFVSETDTVAVVKEKVISLLHRRGAALPGGQAPVNLEIEKGDHLTLYCSGRPLQDKSLFYSDNYILLPVWIQVLLHHCESEEAVQLITGFQN